MGRWLLAIALASCCVCSSLAACPPQGFDSMTDLDLGKFLQGTWYSQQQVLTRNFKADMLNCVKAEYKPRDAADLSKGIEVLHYANKGQVNGPAIDTNADTRSKETTNLPSLVAFPATAGSGDRPAAAASKLKVGPGLLEAAYKTGMKRIFANHWVVAAGKSADPALGYDWAVVTAGAPAHRLLNGKCRTGDALGNYQGVWLYSRKSVDPDNTATMRRVAESLGLDISNLKPVTQVGCTYTPVPAKPVSTTISIKPEEVAAAMKDALAAAGLTEEEAKQEQQQHQKLNQQSRMRQGLFGEGGIHLPKLPSPFHKHGGSGSNAAAAEIAAAAPAAAATPAAAAASTAAANTPVAVASTQAAAPAQAPAGPVTSDPLSVTHKAEFNVTAGGKLIGKVVVGLFGNTAPKTVQNFVSICKGAKGINYKGSQFHRVIKDFMIQGGDFERGDGTGGFSIFGETFPDEPMGLKLQLSRGVIAMANAGPDTNGSQFFITVVGADWLNGKHVVFGRVLKGMDIVDEISDMKVDATTDRPLSPVVISGCKAWKEHPKSS